jgi:GNAT superfamily N-acetyltransferase
MQVNVNLMPHCEGLIREIAMMGLDRSVHKELGSAVWSDPDHKWWLAYVTNSDVNPVGMCAAVNKGRYYQFCHDYVLPEFRGHGIYNRLFTARMLWLNIHKHNARAACTKMSVGTYMRHGFMETRQTVNYTFVERF